MQITAVVLAIVCAIVYLTRWAERHHAAVVEQIDRVEAAQDRTIRYTLERDRRWAEAIGLPDPTIIHPEPELRTP